MTAEEEVRAAWKDTILGGLYLYESTRSYHLQLGCWEYKGNVKDKDAVWQAALAYTLERKEQIRQAEEELLWLEGSTNSDIIPLFIKDRIRNRIEEALTKLKKGMKEQPNGK